MDQFLYKPSPWGLPLLMGSAGKSGSTEEATVWIALDEPVPWLRPTAPLGKSEVEWLQVQRFATDYRLALGSEVYDAIEPNPHDPPDFIAATLEGGHFGIELVALSAEERREADALFHTFRLKLAAQHRHRTGHLAGSRIVVWFGKEQNPLTRPPRKSDDQAADELIEALVAYRPDHQRLVVSAEGGLPAHFPSLGTITTPHDATFYAVPLVSAVPTGAFFCVTGFEISLAFTTVHTASSVRSTVERLVSDHDKPGVDILLISVGSVDRTGAIHHAEDVLADLYLNHPASFQPDHLQRIILHRWISGEAFDLLGPTPTRLFGPLYDGLTPSFHALRPATAEHEPLPGAQAPESSLSER